MSHIVLIDSFCVFHAIANGAATLGLTGRALKGYVAAQLVSVASLSWLGGLATGDDIPVFTFDNKETPYWRKSVYPEYKAGRERSEATINGLQICVQTLPQLKRLVLSVPTQESDDIIAGIVRVRPENSHITIATVDSDLIGLVVEGEVGWFSTDARWVPRYRHDLESINKWALKRHKILLEAPRDLWAFKSAEGDKSDNLPKGADISLIDLLNPPPEFDILRDYDTVQQLRSVFSIRATPQPQALEASEYLRKRGYPQCIKPYRPE
jgi:5'-3' exonuclease